MVPVIIFSSIAGFTDAGKEAHERTQMGHAACEDTDSHFQRRPDGNSGGAEKEFVRVIVENEEA